MLSHTYESTPETGVHTLTFSWQLLPSFTQPWWTLRPARTLWHIFFFSFCWRMTFDNISAVMVVWFCRSASAILPTTFICVGGIQLFLPSEPCTVPAVRLTVAMFTHIAALCVYFRPFCTQYTGDKCNDLHGYNFTAVKIPPTLTLIGSEREVSPCLLALQHFGRCWFMLKAVWGQRMKLF